MIAQPKLNPEHEDFWHFWLNAILIQASFVIQVYAINTHLLFSFSKVLCLSVGSVKNSKMVEISI